jgi:RND superfamily putative drug exporter
MLSRLLGRLIRGGWILWLLGWLVLLIGSDWLAPRWNDVAQDKQFGFLPADTPSRQAEAVYAEAFPDNRSSSNIVLVLHRQDTQPGTLDRDIKFIENVIEPDIRRIADEEGGFADEPPPSDEPLFADGGPAVPSPSTPPGPRPVMARLRTPSVPGSGAFLISPDEQALLVVIELSTEFLTNRNWPVIAKVEQLVRDIKQQEKVPPGIDIAVTGSAVIGRDHSQAQRQSGHTTTVLTIILVIALLIVIYRAPFLALIPLATVYLAIRVGLNLLGILAAHGYMTIFSGLEIYITILAYGAGVDYCLFLTARYREELERSQDPGEAVAAAVGGVGAAIAASAAAVMCGIGMMSFAAFGKFHEAGLAIPFCLLFVFAATLTFSPSLLRLAGRWAFWPRRLGQIDSRSQTGATRWWHSLAGMLQKLWETIGHKLIAHPGRIWLYAFSAMLPFAVAAGVLNNHLSYDLIAELPPDAPSQTGTRLLQEHFPAGILGTITVLLVDRQADFAAPSGRAMVEKLTDQLRDQKQDLGLADVRSLIAPLGISEASKHAFVGSKVPADVRQEAIDRFAKDHYTTSIGERARIGTRLDLILQDGPFSQQSLNYLNRIEQTLREDLSEDASGGQLYFVGTTASVRDLQTVTQGDRQRIEILVLSSVFLVLVVLLRRLIVPVYLLLSVLFSYFVTLGAAFAVFWLLDPANFTGLDWQVALFLFTILIAVGADYNIFLVTRIDEEERQFGPVTGVTEALTRTGPIISSCGIIMAGTFAALLAGSLIEMKQLGFALPFGVLLDTFVVRPILVPAFFILLRTGRIPWLGHGEKFAVPHPILRRDTRQAKVT